MSELFLPILGTRVLVIGTKHNGFRGTVVEKPNRHNIFTEWELWLKEVDQ